MGRDCKRTMASCFISERLVKIIRPIDTKAIQGSTYFIALGLKLVSMELNIEAMQAFPTDQGLY